MNSFYEVLIFLTDFANQGVIIPLSLVIGCYFWYRNWKNGAYAWALAIILTLSIIVGSKVFFYVMANFIDIGVNLKSPSAHSAAGALVYGSLLGLLFGRNLKSIVIASILCALVFSYTRIGLVVHTRSEVVIGSLLGIAGSIMFVKLCGTVPDSLKRIPLGVIAGITIVLTYGNQFSGEFIIRSASRAISMLLKHALANQIGG